MRGCMGLGITALALAILFVGMPPAQAQDQVYSSGPTPKQEELMVRDYYIFPEYHWQAGQPATKMMTTFEGFCSLTGVRGPMDGKDDRVRIYVGEDHHWYLGGSATSRDFAAAARCFRLHKNVTR